MQGPFYLCAILITLEKVKIGTVKKKEGKEYDQATDRLGEGYFWFIWIVKHICYNLKTIKNDKKVCSLL